MKLDCLITGVGGQGTVLLSRLIGEAAVKRGLDIRGSETIGMAQRGGSVTSHLRVGEGVSSPLIGPGGADVLIAFEPAEAARALSFLSPRGRLLVLDRGIPPVSSMLGKPYDPAVMVDYLRDRLEGEGRLSLVPWESLRQYCDSPRVLNVALLGWAIAGGLLPFSREEILAVLRERLPPKYLDMNIRALGAHP
ncbi:MAG: indolepyruvate oxidoreductase subunit beta [Treponema sp.]|jgi:indolepyruvate ferredoxin oxidoreductase beta subunit|nr:indolepyruvate oxidoreductase subunit beta [Treponema sp.]